MNLVWSPEAIDDLIAVGAYIEQDQPAAAQRIALHIIQSRTPKHCWSITPKWDDRAEFQEPANW